MIKKEDLVGDKNKDMNSTIQREIYKMYSTPRKRDASPMKNKSKKY
jgi:hypothetical protein